MTVREAELASSRIYRRLYTSLAIAAAVYVVDALVLDHGVWALLTTMIVFVIRFPLAIVKLMRTGWSAARIHVITGAIYLLMAVAVLGTKYTNEVIARHRADMVISAVRHYEHRHNRLPTQLEELVPDFLPSVPRAKYTLLFGSFWYLASPNHHTLMWMTFPPFGRMLYRFEDGKWGQLD
jgi:hypothetical protein